MADRSWYAATVAQLITAEELHGLRAGWPHTE
jgi:hypothetical protein